MQTSRRAPLSSPRSTAKARHSRLTREAADSRARQDASSHCLAKRGFRCGARKTHKKFSVRACPAAAVALQQLQLGSAGAARRGASSLRSTLSFWLNAWARSCGCPVWMSCDITRMCDSLDPAATSVSPSGCAPSLLCLLQSSPSAKSLTLDAAPAESMATGHQPKTKKKAKRKEGVVGPPRSQSIRALNLTSLSLSLSSLSPGRCQPNMHTGCGLRKVVSESTSMTLGRLASRG